MILRGLSAFRFLLAAFLQDEDEFEVTVRFGVNRRTHELAIQFELLGNRCRLTPDEAREYARTITENLDRAPARAVQGSRMLAGILNNCVVAIDGLSPHGLH